MVPVTAKLIESETGNVVDEQIVIPDPGQSPVSIMVVRSFHLLLIIYEFHLPPRWIPILR